MFCYEKSQNNFKNIFFGYFKVLRHKAVRFGVIDIGSVRKTKISLEDLINLRKYLKIKPY